VTDEAVCRHCLQILSAETIKISKFCTIHLLILTGVSRSGGPVTFWGLAPAPAHAWRHGLGY